MSHTGLGSFTYVRYWLGKGTFYTKYKNPGSRIVFRLGTGNLEIRSGLVNVTVQPLQRPKKLAVIHRIQSNCFKLLMYQEIIEIIALSDLTRFSIFEAIE